MRKGFFTTNIWLKLASLGLAIILWFFVMMSSRSEIIVDVPIEYVNVPQRLEIVDAPKTVGIGIEGQERLLKNIKKDNISVIVDMDKFKEGRLFFSLSKENIKLPKRIMIISISPRTISVTLKKINSSPPRSHK